MSQSLIYPSEKENGCPIIEKPGININVIIQIVIAGVIIWFLVNKR